MNIFQNVLVMYFQPWINVHIQFQVNFMLFMNIDGMLFYIM
jgi:hypothetical protein